MSAGLPFVNRLTFTLTVGGAIASQNGYYGPGYYAPGYGGPAYVVDPGYGESCFWQRQRFWDGYGWRVRSVRVCD